MKLVVKIGGAALDDKELVSKFAKTIPDLCREGHRLVIVHGGGAALSRTLKQLGCETSFINGLARHRFADARRCHHGSGRPAQQAVGGGRSAPPDNPRSDICGGDLRMVLATRKKQPDLGYVGEICAVDPQWIERFWNAGVVPVVSSLALGFDGEYYNVNADQMASALARGLRCRCSGLSH